jgi:regulator of sigma E protease
MMDIILQIIVAAIGFSFMVFVHEFGHFIIAILFKIKVEKFSIGMGPAIWGFQKGDTYFQVGAVPFGGFCKFKGDEITDDFNVTKDPDSFYSVKPYKRMLVALFGPFMNYIIAIILLMFLAMGTHKEYYQSTKIILLDDIERQPEDTPAKKAGLLSNDVILAIDGEKISTYEEMVEKISINKGPHKLTVLRNGDILTLNVTPQWKPESMRYIVGIYSYIEPIIKDNDENKFQHLLGLKDGDRIIGIDEDYTDISVVKFEKFIADNFGKDKRSVIHIRRDRNIVDIPVVFNELNHQISEKELRLDYYFPWKTVKGKNIIAALSDSFLESTKVIRMTVFGLYAMIFMPKKNVEKQVGGVVLIGHLIGKTTIEAFKVSIYEGFRNFFSIIAIISLALAFFNLLPIPALDGGHILMSLIEIITGKQISIKFQYIINFIFFIILMGLGLLFVYLDILRLSGGQ